MRKRHPSTVQRPPLSHQRSVNEGSSSTLLLLTVSCDGQMPFVLLIFAVAQHDEFLNQIKFQALDIIAR
jgi:hypothetical protein